MPLNPIVAPVEQEKLEEASLDMNVSQWLRKEELFRRVVRILVDCSTWDCRLFPNPHAWAIYLEFVPTSWSHAKKVQKGLKSVNAKMMMFVSIVERGSPVMAIIVGYEGRSTPFPWSIEPNT
jgi:hypothetical protein